MAALVERAMLILMMMLAVQVSCATVYKVGDSDGWTIIGNVDYKKWAAIKNFQVGDTISSIVKLGIRKGDPSVIHAMVIYQPVAEDNQAKDGYMKIKQEEE